ncbi:MAG TPA: DUF2189 domain-containing protein [Alphaproteobacteria bacterium]|nr:DUF2189 domain-containing protein [Alphaproteobacteria bacterium]
MSDAIPVFSSASPRVRQVPVDRAWTWLAAGWNDILGAPHVSLAYGALLVAISVALTFGLWLLGWIYLLLPLAAGFMFVAPVLAIGLYETSRRLAAGEPTSLGAAIAGGRTNRTQIALMGLILMLFNLAWVRIATLLFALFFNDVNPGLERLLQWTLFSAASLPFLMVGTAIGAALAVIVFAISAVSLPLLVDRDENVFTAIATSVTAVQVNWRAMALWAALIVVFTGLGIATFFLGLAITLPLIGHATWHAYKDLVE